MIASPSRLPRLALALALAAIAPARTAAAATVPLDISIFPPAGLFSWMPDKSVIGLQLAVPYAVSEDLFGISGGVVSLTRGTSGAINGGAVTLVGGGAYGITAGGFWTHAGGPVIGLQVGGLAATAQDKAFGIQVGGLYGHALGTVVGIKVGGLVSLAGQDAYGIHVGGLLARTSGSFGGIQVGGIAQLTNGDFTGLGVGGTFNWVDGDMTGLQIGGLTTRARTMSGLQIGFMNMASKVRGVSDRRRQRREFARGRADRPREHRRQRGHAVIPDPERRLRRLRTRAVPSPPRSPAVIPMAGSTAARRSSLRSSGASSPARQRSGATGWVRTRRSRTAPALAREPSRSSSACTSRIDLSGPIDQERRRVGVDDPAVPSDEVPRLDGFEELDVVRDGPPVLDQAERHPAGTGDLQRDRSAVVEHARRRLLDLDAQRVAPQVELPDVGHADPSPRAGRSSPARTMAGITPPSPPGTRGRAAIPARGAGARS